MENIVKKASTRLYMLYQLQRAGITQKDPVSVYVSALRPILEYVLYGILTCHNICLTILKIKCR